MDRALARRALSATVDRARPNADELRPAVNALSSRCDEPVSPVNERDPPRTTQAPDPALRRATRYGACALEHKRLAAPRESAGPSSAVGNALSLAPQNTEGSRSSLRRDSRSHRWRSASTTGKPRTRRGVSAEIASAHASARDREAAARRSSGHRRQTHEILRVRQPAGFVHVVDAPDQPSFGGSRHVPKFSTCRSPTARTRGAFSNSGKPPTSAAASGGRTRSSQEQSGTGFSAIRSCFRRRSESAAMKRRWRRIHACMQPGGFLDVHAESAAAAARLARIALTGAYFPLSLSRDNEGRRHQTSQAARHLRSPPSKSTARDAAPLDPHRIDGTKFRRAWAPTTVDGSDPRKAQDLRSIRPGPKTGRWGLRARQDTGKSRR